MVLWVSSYDQPHSGEEKNVVFLKLYEREELSYDM